MKANQKLNKIFATSLVLAGFFTEICIAQDNSHGGFTRNMNQLLDTEDEVTDDPLYYAYAGRQSYFLLGTKIAYAFSSNINRENDDTLFRMDLTFYNANASSNVSEGTKQFYNNYYLAHTGANGIDCLGVYESVNYTTLVNDVEISCRMINGLQLKFTVDESVDPNSLDNDGPLSFYFNGSDSTRLFGDTIVKVYCPFGTVVFDSLFAYQVINEQTHVVDIGYDVNTVCSRRLISFDVGNYNSAYPLFIVIGPLPNKGSQTDIFWSTFIQGSNFDGGQDVWIADDDFVYLVGAT